MPDISKTVPAKKTRRTGKSYEERSGMNKRAGVILVKAIFTKPETIEDENGNVMRVWKPNEMQAYSNADIASVLANRVALEANEMLGTVPPSAIKYAVTKGWLVTDANRALYRVTLKGAIELNLPMRFKGGEHHGRRIPFVLPATKPTK